MVHDPNRHRPENQKSAVENLQGKGSSEAVYKSVLQDLHKLEDPGKKAEAKKPSEKHEEAEQLAKLDKMLHNSQLLKPGLHLVGMKDGKMLVADTHGLGKEAKAQKAFEIDGKGNVEKTFNVYHEGKATRFVEAAKVEIKDSKMHIKPAQGEAIEVSMDKKHNPCDYVRGGSHWTSSDNKTWTNPDTKEQYKGSLKVDADGTVNWKGAEGEKSYVFKTDGTQHISQGKVECDLNAKGHLTHVTDGKSEKRITYAKDGETPTAYTDKTGTWTASENGHHWVNKQTNDVYDGKISTTSDGSVRFDGEGKFAGTAVEYKPNGVEHREKGHCQWDTNAAGQITEAKLGKLTLELQANGHYKDQTGGEWSGMKLGQDDYPYAMSSVEGGKTRIADGNTIMMKNAEGDIYDYQLGNGTHLEKLVGGWHARVGSGASAKSEWLDGEPSYKLTDGSVTYKPKGSPAAQTCLPDAGE